MNVKERIKKEIKFQKSIEGDKCQDEILLKFLDAIKTARQWEVFIKVEFYKDYNEDGESPSFFYRRFYYPTEELLKLLT